MKPFEMFSSHATTAAVRRGSEYDLNNVSQQLEVMRIRREQLEARQNQREREKLQVGTYFTRSIKTRLFEAEDAARLAKERNEKLVQQVEAAVKQAKESSGETARVKAGSVIASTRETYLNHVRRMYPHWRHQVDDMIRAQSKVYEKAIEDSETRRKEAAEAFKKELADRAHLMESHHAALQAHEQEGLEELLRNQSRRQLAEQESSVAAVRPQSAPVYIPQQLPPEAAAPHLHQPPVAPTHAVPTLLTDQGPIPYQPAQYPQVVPINVPVPVGNALQQPSQYQIVYIPGQPPQAVQIQPGQQVLYQQPGQQVLYQQPGQQVVYQQPGQQPTQVPSAAVQLAAAMQPLSFPGTATGEAPDPTADAQQQQPLVLPPGYQAGVQAAGEAAVRASAEAAVRASVEAAMRASAQGIPVQPPLSASPPAAAAHRAGVASSLERDPNLVSSGEGSDVLKRSKDSLTLSESWSHMGSPSGRPQPTSAPGSPQADPLHPSERPGSPARPASPVRASSPLGPRPTSPNQPGMAGSPVLGPRSPSPRRLSAGSGEQPESVYQTTSPSQEPPAPEPSVSPQRLSGGSSAGGGMWPPEHASRLQIDIPPGMEMSQDNVLLATVPAKGHRQPLQTSAEEDLTRSSGQELAASQGQVHSSQEARSSLGLPSQGTAASQEHGEVDLSGGLAKSGEAAPSPEQLPQTRNLQGGAAMEAGERQAALQSLVREVYLQRFEGVFYDPSTKANPDKINELLNSAMADRHAPPGTTASLSCASVVQLVRAHPEPLVPRDFARKYLSAKADPFAATDAAVAAGDELRAMQEGPARAFYGTLLEHLAHMVKSHVTDPHQAASSFASLLIPTSIVPPKEQRQATRYMETFLAAVIQHETRRQSLAAPPKKKEVGASEEGLGAGPGSAGPASPSVGNSDLGSPSLVHTGNRPEPESSPSEAGTASSLRYNPTSSLTQKAGGAGGRGGGRKSRPLMSLVGSSSMDFDAPAPTQNPARQSAPDAPSTREPERTAPPQEKLAAEPQKKAPEPQKRAPARKGPPLSSLGGLGGGFGGAGSLVRGGGGGGVRKGGGITSIANRDFNDSESDMSFDDDKGGPLGGPADGERSDEFDF